MEKENVLIISQNPIEECGNTGKTLLSFFEGYPEEKIAQLYFYPSMPYTKYRFKFFRITEYDILNYWTFQKRKCGMEVCTKDVEEKKAYLHSNRRIKNLSFVRWCRELLWKTPWEKQTLYQWITKFSPDHIFAVCGDGLFTYEMTMQIAQKTGADISVFLTDDYILKRDKNDCWKEFKRKKIEKYLYHILKKSKNCFVISPFMKEQYDKLFEINSDVIMNISEIERRDVECKHDDLLLVYSGNLEFNRDKTLIQLLEYVDKYNYNNDRKIKIEIYSAGTVSKEMKQILVQYKTGYFGGKLNKEQLEKKLNEADILLHVESFDREDINNTKLSISTKIYEYLSLGKPILAIGPNEIASMIYLSEVACNITSSNLENEADKINRLFEDDKYRKSIESKEKEFFEKNRIRKEDIWEKINLK